MRNWALLYQRRALAEETGEFGRHVAMGELSALDGVRVLAGLWLLVTSGFLLTATTSVRNPWEYARLQGSAAFTFLVQGLLCCDLLLAMSAALQFYKMARSAQKSGGVSLFFGESVVLRLLRLLPLYYFVFLFGWAGLPALLQNGPLWERYAQLYTECSRSWWAELLLLGNFVPWTRPPLQGCFFWNWFICVDFQLFLLLPLLVKAWHRWPSKTLRAVAALLALVLLVDFVVIWAATDYTVGLLSPNNKGLESALAERPWGRLDVFLLGTLFAMLLLSIRDSREHQANLEFFGFPAQVLGLLSPRLYSLQRSGCRLSCLLNLLGALGFAVTAGTVFVTVPAHADPLSWPRWANALYLSVSGVFFSGGVFCVVLVTFTGRLRWVKSVLGFELMTPLAKLMYGVYLLSPLIIVAFYVSLENSPTVSTRNLLLFNSAFIIASLGLSALFFFLVDAPFAYQLKDLIKNRWIPQFLSNKY